MTKFVLFTLLFFAYSAGAQSKIEMVSFKMKGGVLNYSLQVLNDTGIDQLIHWKTLDFCPSTNPALLNISTNQYVALMPVGYNHFVHHDYITPFPNGAAVVIACEVLLPDEALPAGDYRFTATHPLDPALTATHSFSLAEPLKEEKGFIAKGSELPFPGSKPPVVSTNLPEHFKYLRNRDVIKALDAASMRWILFWWELSKITQCKYLAPNPFTGLNFAWKLLYPTEIVNDERGLYIMVKRRPKEGGGIVMGEE